MAIQSFPRPTNPKIKKQTDDQLAKVGQLNQLVKDVNGLNVTGPSPVSYGFDWYPDAGLTTGGTMFKYTDGVELISYHIKGMYSIGNNGNGFEVYLCTVSFPQFGGIFPGSVTGAFQIQLDNNFITTPLANGGLLLFNGNGTIPVSDFTMYLYPYENPQPDGNYYYALVASGTIADSGSLSAVMCYDFEFSLPNFVTPPTIFQD
jgi:hypothetical protein